MLTVQAKAWKVQLASVQAAVSFVLRTCIPVIQLSNHLVYIGFRYFTSTSIGQTVGRSVEIRV